MAIMAVSSGVGLGWVVGRAAVVRGGSRRLRAARGCRARNRRRLGATVGVGRLREQSVAGLVDGGDDVGLVDGLVLMAVLPRYPRFLGKATLYRILPLAPFLHLAGVVPVHRAKDAEGASGRAVTRNDAAFRTSRELLARLTRLVERHGDARTKRELVRRLATEAGAYASEINTAFENGGTGATALAEAVIAAADEPNTFDFAYTLDAPIEEKIRLIATRVYGADGVELLPPAKKKAADWADSELARLPICMAKTHLSLSHDPALKNAPTGFTVTLCPGYDAPRRKRPVRSSVM